MSNHIEPNYQILKLSTVQSIKSAYLEYKKLIIKSLQYSWITDEGDLAVIDGLDEITAEISSIESEIGRLKKQLAQINSAAALQDSLYTTITQKGASHAN